MCGWPAGVGFPPIDGELEAAAAAAATGEPEPQTDQDAEHAAAQLDALAGMASRQSQPAPDPSEPVKEPVEQTEQIHESDGSKSETIAVEVVDAVQVERGTDPLTAPIETLPDPSSESLPTLEPAIAPSFPTRDTTVSSPSRRRSVSAASGRATSLARPAQLLIVAAAVLNLVMAGMQMAFGAPVDESMTPIVLGVALVTLGVWTAAAVVFLHWVSRAYTTVAEEAAYQQRHGAVMALVGWLIPIVGFFVGYRVLQDLWTGSNPETRGDASAKPSGARVIDLWLLGLITATAFAYGVPMALGDSAVWSGIAAVGVAIAGLSLASVISTVSAWQSETETGTTDQATMVDEGTVSTRVDELIPDAVSSEEPAREPAGSATE